MTVLLKETKKVPDINWHKYKLALSKRTIIMGVLNRTPDSFSDGGCFMEEDKAVEHAIKLVEEGADILDIGGESTRPGAKAVSVNEELKRTIPIIKRLSKSVGIPISIDTSSYEVAKAALESGANMVNDINGLKKDLKMADLVASYDVPVVLMHIQGTPEKMQTDPVYLDLISEIIDSLKVSIDIAKRAGVDEKKIIIDPGIGFGKTAEHNLEIINNLNRFKELDKPILIGVSRKSFIGKVLDLEVDKRIMGTACSCALAIANGANIIRVHEVSQMRQIASMADAILAS